MFLMSLNTLDGVQQVLPAAVMSEFTKYEALDLINRERPNLSGCDLSELALKGQAFTGAMLIDVDFSGCDLSQATFYQSKMLNCRFDGANLSQSIVRECSVVGCSFEGANLESSGFAAYAPQPVTADA